jgi:hypothetical protein
MACPPHYPPILVHVQLVGRIALLTGAAALIGLLGIIIWVSNHDPRNYQEIIGAYLRAEERLSVVTLVFGCFAAAFAGVTTWLIALYSSFRIAGPLYRFARNLEEELARGPVVPVPIRRGDALQAQAQAFEQAVSALHGHYQDLRRALSDVERELQATDGAGSARLAAALHRLREIDHRVSL